MRKGQQKPMKNQQLFDFSFYLFDFLNIVLIVLFLGFGEHIKWYKLDDALEEAKSTNLPIMLVVHKTWCGACKGED